MSGHPVLYSRRVRDEWRGHFDMLHDTKRNKAYATWIHRVTAGVDRTAASADTNIWCDIGTGSGFLGCLVAQHPSNSVISFETVPELASRARETICRNKCMENNVVWCTHTGQLASDFMSFNFGSKANFVVSELLDTTFLGEGLVEGMRHARDVLLRRQLNGSLQPDVTAVPRYGRVYIQAWSGPNLQGMHGYAGAPLRRDLGIVMPATCLNCKGPSSASTVHAAALLKDGRPISEICTMFTFDLLYLDDISRPSSLSSCFDTISADGISKNISMRAFNAGKVDAYIVWWEVGMYDYSLSAVSATDESEHVFVSTSPFGCDTSPPPDHWRQCVFFQDTTHCAELSVNDNWTVQCCCNESDIWLADVGVSCTDSMDHLPATSVDYIGSDKKRRRLESTDTDILNGVPRHVCTCGHHSLNCCFRFKYINSPQHRLYVSDITAAAIAAGETISTDQRNLHFLILGDSPILLCLILRALSARSGQKGNNVYVTMVVSSSFAVKCCQDFMSSNIRGLGRSKSYGYVESEPYGIIEMEDCSVYCSIVSMTPDDDTGDDGFSQYIQKGDEEHFRTTLRNIEEVKSLVESTKTLVVHEPYFSSIQCEWFLEHILTVWQLLAYLNQTNLQSIHHDTRLEVVPNKIDIYMSLFSCEELWKYCIGDVGVVEGVDVSSMNALLEVSTGSNKKYVDSVYLQQWGAKLVGCRQQKSVAKLLGTVDLLASKVDDVLWEGAGVLDIPNNMADVKCSSVGSFSTISANSGDIHGIAFWAFCSSHCKSNLVIEPSADLLQAVCCFDEVYKVQGDDHAGLKSLMVRGVIDSNYEFTVGII